MKIDRLFEEAESVAQYENPRWLEIGHETNPIREFLKRVIDVHCEVGKGTNTLDIGSGTGWLVNYFHLKGSTKSIGIDPSSTNINYARNAYPGVEFCASSIGNYVCNEKYDLITGLLSFSHIADLESTAQKCYEFLNPNGKLLIIVQDYSYYSIARHGYEVRIEAISNDEYITSVTRSDLVITDIIRRNSVYISAFKQFKLLNEIGIKPDFKLREAYPKYSSFSSVPIFQLLEFRK